MPKKTIARRTLDKLARAKPEKVFLVVALLFGVMFVFLTPPFGVADEPSHFYRSYQISQGVVYSTKFPGGQYGGMLPKNLAATSNLLLGNLPFRTDQKASVKTLRASKSLSINTTQHEAVAYTNTAVYGPLNYLPQATGIFISRALPGQPNFLLTFYLARLFNLLVGIILLYWAIKKLPFAKWAWVLLFLTPMVIFQLASLSPDSLTIGLTAFGIAFGLACLYPSRMLERRELIWLGAIIIAIAMLRVPYSGLAIIPFGVLFYHLRQRLPLLKTLLVVGGVAAVSALWVLSWQHYFGNDVMLTGDPTVDPAKQPATFLNLIHMARVLGQTHLSAFFNLITNGIVGVLGWMDTPLPQWTITGYSFFLIASFFVAKTGETNPLNRGLKWALGGLFLGLVLVLDIIEYVYASPVGSDVINGIQGRYYIPMLVLLALTFYGAIKLSAKDWRKFHLARLGFIGLIQIAAALVLLNRFWLKI